MSVLAEHLRARLAAANIDGLPRPPDEDGAVAFVPIDAPPTQAASLRIPLQGAPSVDDGVAVDASIGVQAPQDVLAAFLGADAEAAARAVRSLVLVPTQTPFHVHMWEATVRALHAEHPAVAAALNALAAQRPPWQGTFTFRTRAPVLENTYLGQPPEPADAPLPTYDAGSLPALIADDHPAWVTMFDAAWRMAFAHLRAPTVGSGLVARFIDTMFNDNTFLWDSVFMMRFGRYAAHVFPFMGTLDNFYAKQHGDGFICREINTYDGRDLWTPQDPRSTGPNVLAWAELTHLRFSQDTQRAARVLPALIAYHRWTRLWRGHPTMHDIVPFYWTSGLGSGMDNQLRGVPNDYHHGSLVWVDAMMQAALSALSLLLLCDAVGETRYTQEVGAEYGNLRGLINTLLWNERTGFYYDALAAEGAPPSTPSIGAYWGLLAGVVDADRAERMMARLEDPAWFNRPHRVPSLAALAPGYAADGDYWRGGVWSPTNDMVLRGLAAQDTAKADGLAHAIALNHLGNMAAVFAETGTLWENYAPEYAGKGRPSRPDFVGWTGVSAIATPIEHGVGLRPPEALGAPLLHPADAPIPLVWDVRLRGRHGVLRYPLRPTPDALADFVANARPSDEAPPTLHIVTPRALALQVRWAGGARRTALHLPPGAHTVTLEA